MKSFRVLRNGVLSGVFIVSIALGSAHATAQPADPLPSWNDGRVKEAVIGFVTSVTTEGDPDYVPVEDRIATFDNDGTLWCEQPVVQGMFLMYRLQEMAKKNPSIREEQPFKAAFEHDKPYLKSEGMPAIMQLFAATHAGMRQEDFDAEVKEFFAAVKHPTLDVPIGQVVYKPMIELLTYLRAHNFETYICSGGGVDFMRVLSEGTYGVVPENVIGSFAVNSFEQVDGKWTIVKGKKNLFVNDGLSKPVGIDRQIGRVPIFAAGNVRSGGDIGMLSYSQAREGPSLQLLVYHDDEKREFAYAEKDNASLRAAEANQWLVVSLKNDWKSIFPFGRTDVKSRSPNTKGE